MIVDAHMHMDYIDWRYYSEEVYTTSEEAKTLAIVRTSAEEFIKRFYDGQASVESHPTDWGYWM